MGGTIDDLYTKIAEEIPNMFAGAYLISTGTGEFINLSVLHDFKIQYNNLPSTFSFTETDGKISQVKYTGDKDVIVFGITKAKVIRYSSSDVYKNFGSYKLLSNGTYDACGLITATFQKDWGYHLSIPYIVRLSKGDTLKFLATYTSDEYVKTEIGSYVYLTVIKTF